MDGDDGMVYDDDRAGFAIPEVGVETKALQHD